MPGIGLIVIFKIVFEIWGFLSRQQLFIARQNYWSHDKCYAFILSRVQCCFHFCDLILYKFVLKKYYEIVDEARPLSGFSFPHMLIFVTEMHF